MEQNELIKYGFKRVVEEEQNTAGTVSAVLQETEHISKDLRRIADYLETLVPHVISIDGTLMEADGYLKKIAGCEILTETNVIRILNCISGGKNIDLFPEGGSDHD